MSGRAPRAPWRAALFAVGLAVSATAHGDAIRREFYFQSIGIEHGLAQNTVSAFLQDSDGFIWVGTDSGVQKYDGYRFVDFAVSGEPHVAGPEGPISALAEDAGRTLWVGTLAAGLLRHPLDGEGFERVDLGGSGEAINSIVFDPRRGLWVCSSSRIWLLEPASGRVLRELPAPADRTTRTLLRQMSLGADGTLWTATDRRLAAAGARE